MAVIRVRTDDQLKQAYEETVGERYMSEDLRAYMEWRIDNPDMPLPGKRWARVKGVLTSGKGNSTG